MPITPIDPHMIESLKAGDENAFEAIYHCYWERLFAAACHKLKNPYEAEEITQEIFLDLWRRREKLDINTSLNAYLSAAVKYKVINRLAARNRRLRFEREMQVGEGDTTMIATLDFDELQQQLLATVESLPEKCRLVFTLSRSAGMSHKQIAVHLGIAEKTVESHLSRALRSLRSSLRTLFLFI